AQDPQHLAIQRRVSDPLEKLRGFIRLYVTLEGLAILLMYVALWFWIGLVVDYGFFKLTALLGLTPVDWVQDLPRAFRAGVLTLLLAGLFGVVTLKVGFLFMREFSP